MLRCQRLIHLRQPLTRHNSTHAKSQQLLQPVAADMIGTPDPVTNLRPVRYYVPPDETQEVYSIQGSMLSCMVILTIWIGERMAVTTATSRRIQSKLLEEEQYHVY